MPNSDNKVDIEVDIDILEVFTQKECHVFYLEWWNGELTLQEFSNEKGWTKQETWDVINKGRGRENHGI